MQGVRSGIALDANFMNLKPMEVDEIRKEVFDLLVDDEKVLSAFKTIRDQVVFTTKRVFAINVQGITGKKVSYFSYPYSKVQYYGIETAGLLDIDSELVLKFSNAVTLQFDFKASVDIKEISTIISKYIL